MFDTTCDIQGVPLKIGPLARQNQESGPVLSGTLSITSLPARSLVGA
jgi:hypothetical protein